MFRCVEDVYKTFYLMGKLFTIARKYFSHCRYLEILKYGEKKCVLYKQDTESRRRNSNKPLNQRGTTH